MVEYSEDPVERSPHARRNAFIVIGVLIVIAILAWAVTRSGSSGAAQGGKAGASAGRGGAGGRSSRPTATVGIAKVTTVDMPETLSAIGTVQPIVAATVRSQISGNIFTINFTEGQMVQKGQTLAQIDPRPYRIALAQAQANEAKDQAQLNLARVTLKRYQTLLSQDSIARQDVDTQAATAKQYEATVAADRAQVNSAKLNLQYTTIPAPVSGKVGLRQVDIGNYVTPGDSAGIVVITQTTPIDVAFSLPQVDLQRMLAERKNADGLPVVAKDQGGQVELAKGNFLTFDNQIDATTGTVKAKARFPNPDGKLFPNQFVNVTLLADTLRNAPAVPVTAVRHGAQGDFVFVLQDDHTVKLAVVKLGPADQTRVAILQGLTVGQTVVTEGADNLDDGSKVSLPGENQRQRQKKSTGFFGWIAGLFGGGSSNADQAGAHANAAQPGDAAQNGAQADGQPAGTGKKHRRKQQDNGGGQ